MNNKVQFVLHSPRKKLTTPTDFNFPYTPYKIQEDLMQQMYSTLEEKGIGIFESPTGTGKSLTLTCGALRWLEDHEELVVEDLKLQIENLKLVIQQLDSSKSKGSDWIHTQTEATCNRNKLNELQYLQNLQNEYNMQIKKIRQEARKAPVQNLHSEEGKSKSEDESEEDEDDVVVKTNDETEMRYRDVKIYFCSRTHSQLSQVVREIKKTVYGQRVRCVSLGSRQQLCVHPKLHHLTSGALINERCLALSETNNVTKKTSSKHCPFKTKSKLQTFSNAALSDILDIEELVKIGKTTKSCPYYSTREATKKAQIVFLPYQMLLHHNTRIQSGIDIENSVVIIDEAHNLLDTIAQIYSHEISLEQLYSVQSQLKCYKSRFAERLSCFVLLNLNQLLFIVSQLITLFTSRCKSRTSSRVITTFELLSEANFANINLVNLLEFCRNSQIVQKLQKNSVKQQNVNDTENQRTTSSKNLLQQLEINHKNVKCKRQKMSEDSKEKPYLGCEMNANNEHQCLSSTRTLLAFLEAFTDNTSEGCVLLNVDEELEPTRSQLKYVLLNPGHRFQDVVSKARAVIIAGGTLQPTKELVERLFYECPERVRICSYDHVVSSDALLAFVASHGPSGRSICYNYEQRKNKDMFSELAMIIQNLCIVVPAGLICFMPSYEFLDTFYAHLKEKDLISQISSKKRLFRESRAMATGNSVEALLKDFSNAITMDKGALLLSVVGGKLSEGLNFADDLGRGVIVVGMPYPNRYSVELGERMRYLDQTLGKGAGNEYYENLCMKAVNQCIGRSIRHIRDYACVYLLDERYKNDRIRAKLPSWISRSIQIPDTFGQLQAASAKFFRTKVRP